MPEEEEYQYQDVLHCARCQGTHRRMLFRLLANAADEWCWFAMCPVKQQPILMRVVEDKK